MDSINFDTFDSPAGGVELSDTLSSWRKKTNGIVTKISSLDSSLSTTNSNISTLEGKVNNSGFNDHSLTLAKLQEVSNLKVLGNTSGSAGDVAQVSILDQDALSSDSATALATQQSIKAYVDNQFGSDTYDLSTDGYQKLPSGLIMQWGVSSPRVGALQQNQTVTFALEFPNACLNVVGIPDRLTHLSGNLGLYLVGFTNTTATFEYDSDSNTFTNTAVRWQAFGH